MDDEIIIIITDPPRPDGCVPGGFERYDATTLAGLRGARAAITQLIAQRFPEAAEEE